MKDDDMLSDTGFWLLISAGIAGIMGIVGYLVWLVGTAP